MAKDDRKQSSVSAKKPSVRSRQLLKKLPDEKQLAKSLESLRHRSHHAIALVGVSYLDHALDYLIRKNTRDLDSSDDNRIFDGAQGGILSTFSAKIRITYALGWVHANPYKALLVINDIRNVFAHSLNRATFSHALIREDCETLATISFALTASSGITTESSGADIYVSIVKELYRSIKLLAEGADEFLGVRMPGKPPPSV